ncbi:TonB-dependent receptor plug domain-containing protein [Dissulfuribacter thermophilus]|nr:TonB-dependent receptor plug domain-containing protein [Dissulfuribacter thermophilus]
MTLVRFVFVVLFNLLVGAGSIVNASSIYGSIPKATTSTSVTSFSIQKVRPGTVIITSREIEALGVENLVDLLRIIGGANVYRENPSTVKISFPGIPNRLELTPKILIDGMEVTELFLERTHFYNLPVDVQDIDRIELIKDVFSIENGYFYAQGIINIITKHPEKLSKNFISALVGSHQLRKGSFSTGGHIKDGLYVKMFGGYRVIDELHKDRQNNRKQFVTFESEKYLASGKLFLKGSIEKAKVNFVQEYGERLSLKDLEWEIPLRYEVSVDDLLFKYFLINYKYPLFDCSLYYQGHSGNFVHKTAALTTGEFSSNLFKFTLRKRFFVGKHNILSGSEFRHSHAWFKSQGSYERDELILFLEDEILLNENLMLKLAMGHRSTTYEDTQLPYMAYLTYTLKERGIKLQAGTTKTYNVVPLIYKYFTIETEGYLPYVAMIPSKELGPVKIYSHSLSFEKSWQRFSLSVNLSYNKLFDILGAKSVAFGFFPKPFYKFTLENKYDVTTNVISTNLNYRLRNSDFFLTHVYQNKIDGHTFDKRDLELPHHTILAGVMFNGKLYKGSLTLEYISGLDSLTTKIRDEFFVNASLSRSLFNDKMKFSITVNNLFNKSSGTPFRESNFGREAFFSIKYNF